MRQRAMLASGLFQRRRVRLSPPTAMAAACEVDWARAGAVEAAETRARRRTQIKLRRKRPRERGAHHGSPIFRRSEN